MKQFLIYSLIMAIFFTTQIAKASNLNEDNPVNTLTSIELIPLSKHSQIAIKFVFATPPLRGQWKIVQRQNTIILYLKGISISPSVKIPNIPQNFLIKNITIDKSSDNNIITIKLNKSVKKALKGVCYDFLDHKKIDIILDASLPEVKTSVSSKPAMNNNPPAETQQSATGVNASAKLEKLRQEILNNKEQKAIEDILNHVNSSSPSQISTQPKSSISKKSALPSSPLEALVKSFSVLFIIIAIILVSFWGWKQLLAFKQKRLGDKKEFIKILAVHHLSPKQVIALIEVAGERLVLGITPNQITTLAKVEKTKVNNEHKFNNPTTEFSTNLKEETQKVEQTMSKAIDLLKEKMEELKKI